MTCLALQPLALTTPTAHVLHTYNPSVLAHRYKHLTVKSETEEKNGVPLVVLRPAVALAIVKILMRLPVWMLESKLPQLLTRVAAVMRDRCVLRLPDTLTTATTLHTCMHVDIAAATIPPPHRVLRTQAILLSPHHHHHHHPHTLSPRHPTTPSPSPPPPPLSTLLPRSRPLSTPDSSRLATPRACA
jgi:hypothetical protein